MAFIQRILTWISNIIPTQQGDHVNEWEKVKQEGKAVREEFEKLSEKPKEVTDSTES